MPIVGFGYDKILVERKGAFSSKDKIQNHVKITDIKESKLIISTEEKKTLTILFEYTVDYGNAGIINLNCHILYFDNTEKLDEIKSNWDKEKKVTAEFGTTIYNYIFHKANLKAIALEDEVNLPPHLRFPRLKLAKSGQPTQEEDNSPE